MRVDLVPAHPPSKTLLNVFLGGKPIGEFIQDVDGFYYWWMDGKVGTVPACFLRALADKLDEINGPWEKVINEEFEKQEKAGDTREEG